MLNKGAVTMMKQTTQLLAAFLLALLSTSAFAAGGLAAATTQVTDIKTWMYGILGAGVFVYFMYLVIMALFERKQWADVLVGLGYVALAGGSLVGAKWAWDIFV